MVMERLSPDEVERVLRMTWEGVLGLVDGDRPYCIPIAHVYSKGFLYVLFLEEGRKTRCVKRNRNACYLVHCKIDRTYYSILVEGFLEIVRDEDEIRDVLEEFYERVFPKDPFFSMFREREIYREIMDVCMDESDRGLYRIVPRDVSGFKKSF